MPFKISLTTSTEQVAIPASQLPPPTEYALRFKIKDFRSTFAYLSVQVDPNLMPEVSIQLGHSSILTTQRFYADMDLVGAGSKLRKAWSKMDEGPKNVVEKEKGRNPIKALIKPKEYLSGYA